MKDFFCPCKSFEVFHVIVFVTADVVVVFVVVAAVAAESGGDGVLVRDDDDAEDGDV